MALPTYDSFYNNDIYLTYGEQKTPYFSSPFATGDSGVYHYSGIDRTDPWKRVKRSFTESLVYWAQSMNIAPLPSTPTLLSDEFSDYAYPMFPQEEQYIETDELEPLLSQRDDPFLTCHDLWGQYPNMFMSSDELPGFSSDISALDLIRGRMLASGGFKTIFEGEYDNRAVALSVPHMEHINAYGECVDYKNDPGFRHQANRLFLDEIEILRQLRHENVVEYVGSCLLPDDRFCMVTELCEGGDFFDLMRSPHVLPPSLQQKIAYMHDIALGLHYLHMRLPSVVHRDIKSLNILLSRDNRAKIADFGLAKCRSTFGERITGQCGSLHWQAPELWTDSPEYTEKVDVYSYALVCWEILTWGECGYPFERIQDPHVLKRKVARGMRPPLEVSDLKALNGLYNLSDLDAINAVKDQPKLNDLIVLIKIMWAQQPSERPSMSWIVEELGQLLD